MVELVDTLPWGGSGHIHGCASSSLVRRTIRIKKECPKGIIFYSYNMPWLVANEVRSDDEVREMEKLAFLFPNEEERIAREASND